MKLIILISVLFFGLLCNGKSLSNSPYNLDLKFRNCQKNTDYTRIQTSKYHFKIQYFKVEKDKIVLIKEIIQKHMIITDSLIHNNRYLIFHSRDDSLIIYKKNAEYQVDFYDKIDNTYEEFRVIADFTYDDLQYSSVNWNKPCIRLLNSENNFVTISKKSSIKYQYFGMMPSDLLIITDDQNTIIEADIEGSAYITTNSQESIELSIYSISLDSVIHTERIPVVSSEQTNPISKENQKEVCNYINTANSIYLKKKTINTIKVILSNYSINDLKFDLSGGKIEVNQEKSELYITPNTTICKLEIFYKDKLILTESYISK